MEKFRPIWHPPAKLGSSDVLCNLGFNRQTVKRLHMFYFEVGRGVHRPHDEARQSMSTASILALRLDDARLVLDPHGQTVTANSLCRSPSKSAAELCSLTEFAGPVN